MNFSKLRQLYIRSKKSAGPRYTPGTDPDAPNLNIEELDFAMQGLIAGADSTSLIKNLSDELLKAFNKSENILRNQFPRRFKLPKGIIGDLNSLSIAIPGDSKKLVNKLRKKVFNCKSTLNKLQDDLYHLQEKRRENLRLEMVSDEQLNYEDDKELKRLQKVDTELRDYNNALGSISDYVHSTACKLLNNNRALLLGEWGSGKTHYLCDLTGHLLSRKVPSVLLLAKDFSPHPDVCTAIVDYIGATKKITTLINKLNNIGKSKGKRALIIIDGVNESEHSSWMKGIKILSDLVAKKNYVGLVLSCRSPFEKLVFDEGTRKKFVDLYHPGFNDIEFDAQSVFFKYYEISLPEIPLLAEEFSRPLTLKIMCEAFKELPKKDQKRGFVGLASGQRGMTFILEKFINTRSKRIEKELKLPNKFCWSLIKGERFLSDDKLSGIAPYMASMLQEHVPLEVCKNIILSRDHVKNRTQAKKIYNELIGEGILVEDLHWRPDSEGGSIRIVRLPYQRFSDHIIARHLLSKYLDNESEKSIRRSLYKNKPLGQLFITVGDYSTRYRLDGWVEAVLVEFPERVKNTLKNKPKELLFYLPKSKQNLQSYAEPFLSGLFWRSPSAFCKGTDRIVNYLLWHWNSLMQDKMFEVLVALSTKSKHPYNSNRLFNNIEKLTTQERDLSWSEFLRKGVDDGAVERILIWFEKHVPSGLNTENSTNLITVISLFFTTTNRDLRDRSTYVLVCLGEKFPSELFQITLKCLKFNDLYVPERMLAASYGVVMSLWADRNNSRFHTAISAFARSLVELMFLPSGCFKTHHILARDYALGIIELARKINRGCIAPKNVKYIKPPYHGLVNPFPNSNKVSKKQTEEAGKAIHMDFGNYTLGRLVKDRRNYDDSHPEFQKIRKQIEWRLLDLGYSFNKFQSIDNEIGRYGFQRQQADYGKIDRYGKKYSWIAYFEMYGLLDSQNKFKDECYESRPSDSDLDPSFPKSPPSWTGKKPYVLERGPYDEYKWLTSGSSPTHSNYLKVSKVDDEIGPWILLNGYINETDPKDYREYFSFLNGYFVNEEDIAKFKKLLKKYKHPGNELPSVGHDTYTFAGEVPWSNNFAHCLRNSRGVLKDYQEEAYSEYKQVIKRKRVKKAWKLIYDMYNDLPKQSIDLVFRIRTKDETSKSESETELWSSRIEDVNKIVNQQDKIDISDLLNNIPSVEEVISGFINTKEHINIPGITVSPTTWGYQWESYHSRLNEFSGFKFPNPNMIEQLDLRSIHRSIELKDSKMRLASIYRDIPDNEYLKMELSYFRKDLLDKYLKITGKKLIWIVWGERSFHYDKFKDHDGRSEFSDVYQSHEHLYKSFKVYKP